MSAEELENVPFLEKQTCKPIRIIGVSKGMINMRTNRQLFLDKPEGITITTRAAQNAAIQGDNVTLTCNVAAANPPLLEYRFYLNDSDKAFNSVTNINQYTIHDVQRSRDYGEYKCVASNSVGNGQSDTVILNIKGK